MDIPLAGDLIEGDDPDPVGLLKFKDGIHRVGDLLPGLRLAGLLFVGLLLVGLLMEGLCVPGLHDPGLI